MVSLGALFSFIGMQAIAASFDLLPVDAEQLDLTDSEDLVAFLDQLRPSIIVNAAAFTQVDDAEVNQAAAMR